MRAPATDEEQVAFWRRHTWTGVALCVVLPVVVVVETLLSPGSANRVALLVLSALVAVPAPLLLRVPVERLALHPHGHWFFDVWEGLGILLVVLFALLDGGAHSPYVACFYVLLAHAALAYPPVGMAIAGSGNVVGFLLVGLLGGDASPGHLVAGAMTLAVATAICAFASYNHRLVNQRTAAIARQLAVLAEQDGLTGCLNHRAFHERLTVQSGSPSAHPLSLLVIDVDDFKRVNDTFGHPAGDDVLRLVGQTLRGLTQPGDVAGRLGGDEFALLLPGTSSATALATADRLRDLVRARAQPWGATVSVGVATTTLPGDTAGLLAAADGAVYGAKRAGRDRTGGRSPAPTGSRTR